MFSWKMCSKPLKKTFKTKVNQNKAVFLIYGALRSIILCSGHQNCSVIVPEKKEKRIDYNICEAVNGALSEIDM